MNDDQTTVMFIAGFAIYTVFFGGIGYLIGKSRNRGGEGFLLGFLLSALGWLVVVCLGEKGDKCPECFGVVPPGARKCKHCGSDLAHPAPALLPPTAPPSEEGFYVMLAEKMEGPFTRRQLKELIEAGSMKYSTLVAREGDSTWQPAELFVS